MPFNYQAYHTEPYRNPLTNTLIALTGGADRARAAEAEQEGAINANMGGQITGAITGTLGTLANAAMRRQDPAYQLEGMKLKQAKQDQADDLMLRQSLAKNQGNPVKALADLRARGEIGVGAAGKLQTQISQQQHSALADADDQLKRTGMQLGIASQLLQGVPDPIEDDAGNLVPHPQAAEAYGAVAPKLREVLGPDLGKSIPDEYDPAVVARMRAIGETATQHIERQRLALASAQAGTQAKKDSREADEHFTKALGLGLSTAESQDEWDRQVGSAEALGASKATVAKFGKEFSPEAAKKALSMVVSPDERAKEIAPKKERPPAEPGSVAAMAEAFARDKKVPVDTLSLKDNETIARKWVQLHDKGDKPDGAITAQQTADYVTAITKFPKIWNDLTDTMKSKLIPALAASGFTEFGAPSTATTGAALRWKGSQLAELEKERRASQLTPGNEMSDADYQARKDGIETLFQQQVGAAGKPAPGGGGAGGQVTPPVAAPAAPATADAIPANVTAALKGKKSGKYTLTDGRVFLVQPNGTIQASK